MRGVLFDFNGTMLFDTKFHEIAWKDYLEKLIGRRVSDQELQDYVYGINANVTLPHFLQREMTQEEVDRLEEGKEKIYRQMCLDNPDEFHLVDGLPEFLDALKEKGVPMNIATASAFNNVKFFFEHLDLGRWFDIDTVVYNDSSFRGKPHPDIFLLAAKRIGMSTEDCIIFEDTKAGLEAARRAKAAMIVGVGTTLDEKTLESTEDVAMVLEDFQGAMERLEPFLMEGRQ